MEMCWNIVTNLVTQHGVCTDPWVRNTFPSENRLQLCVGQQALLITEKCTSFSRTLHMTTTSSALGSETVFFCLLYLSANAKLILLFSFLYHLWCSYFPHWWTQTEKWMLPQSGSSVYAFLVLCSTASKWGTPATKQHCFCYIIIFPVCNELSNSRIHLNYSHSTGHAFFSHPTWKKLQMQFYERHSFLIDVILCIIIFIHFFYSTWLI